MENQQTQPNEMPNQPRPGDTSDGRGDMPRNPNPEDDNFQPGRNTDPNRADPTTPGEPDMPTDPEMNPERAEQEREITEKTIPFPKPGN